MTKLLLGMAIIAVGATVFGCAGKRPAALGLREGRLNPCPASPNCVSSQATDDLHRIAPLAYEGAPAAAKEALKRAIAAMPRAVIVTETDTYLHAEFTSRLFRFVDDVELAIEPGAVQVRSASRVGYGDMGVNRKRVEELRRRFTEELRAPAKN